MREKTNKVYLTEIQRDTLLKIIKSGKHSAEKIRRANILIQLDENNPPVKKQIEIAEICHTNTGTVAETAKKFKTVGMGCIERKQRQTPARKPIVTGDIEARIIAMLCGPPPEGHSRWTLRLAEEKAVELEIVPAISDNTIGRVLKKRIKTSSK